MSKEKREILEHLVEYLQDKIDTGYHKIFYNDDMYDEKTIDCINAINDTLEENKRLNNIIETFEEELERKSNMKEEYTCLEHNTFIDIKNTLKSVLKRLQELKGSDKE